MHIPYCKHCNGPSTITVTRKRKHQSKRLWFIDGICNQTGKKVTTIIDKTKRKKKKGGNANAVGGKSAL